MINVVERAVVLAKGAVVNVEDLPESVKQATQLPGASQARISAANLKSALAAPEREIIIEALERNGWNRQNTAKLLGINRTTLYKKMKKYGIEFEKHMMRS